MIKKLFIYVSMLLTLAACSDDLFDAPRTEVPDNGEIPVSFRVPEMVRTATRADGFDEYAFGSVTMLMYSSDNSLIARKDLPGAENGATITVPKEYRKDNGIKFLFFANDPSRNENSFSLTSDIEDPFDAKATSVHNSDETRLVMSGSATLAQLLSLEPVNLYHNAAKVSVHSLLPENSTDTPDLYFPFEVFGPAAQSSLMSGTYSGQYSSKKSKLMGNPSAIDLQAFGNDLNLGKEIFLHPTLNTGDCQHKSYIVMKAEYPVGKGNWYYYCLYFQDKDGKALDLLPNHYYDVNIDTDNMIAGYSTIEEAVENPIPLSSGMYHVFDHSPKIYNIVSDGLRALGVQDRVVHGVSRDDTETFYVKLYSASKTPEADYKDFEDSFKAGGRPCITFTDNWVRIQGVEAVSEADDSLGEIFGNVGPGSYLKPGGDESDKVSDGDTEGRIYAVTVRFTGGSAGNLSCGGTVAWKGLSRNFTVEWNKIFKSDELYKSVKATTSTEGTVTTVIPANTDYFTWIAGVKNDDGAFTTVPSVWGADADANNGEARDNGFHFPMKYGGPAKFEYSVELQKLLTGTDYDFELSLEGDSFITNNVEVSIDAAQKTGDMKGKCASGDGPKFTLKLKPGSNNSNYQSYEYAVGKLVVKFGEDGDYKEIPLYHTGFFHDDDINGAVASGWLSSKYKPTVMENRKYTYYEVIEDANGHHWLDRNLGAHSAQMYIEGNNNATYIGTSEAAGGYYRVADYDNNDGVPDMRAGICPPGFTFPSQDDFDVLTALPTFSTDQTGTYYNARLEAKQKYYNLSDDGTGRKTKYSYFPKSRYLGRQDGKEGEPQAGYYWSSSPVYGLEKDEVGSWLHCLMLSGKNSSFINGEVYCASKKINNTAQEVKGYAMPVRCIAEGEGTVSKVERTSILVKGATHVYLYTLVNGEKNPMTEWPGYAVCTSNTVNQVFNFTYESSINKPGMLYAIFNYKDESGKIHTISRNVTSEGTVAGDYDKTIYYTANGGSNLVGFKLDGGIAPKAEEYGSSYTQTSNGGQWTFAFDGRDSKGGYGKKIEESEDPVDPPTGDKTFRIYWYYKSDWFKGLYLKYNTTTLVDNVYSSYPSDQTLTNGKYGFYSKIEKSIPDQGNEHNIVYFEFKADENFCTSFDIKRLSNYGGGYEHGKEGIPYSTFKLEDDGIYSMYYFDETTYFPGKPSKSDKLTDKDTAESGGDNGDNGNDTEKYTIYYANPENWSKVAVYIIKDSQTYPGAANWDDHKSKQLMTKESDGTYSYKIPKDATEIIFTDGGSTQTANIAVVAEDNHLYYNPNKNSTTVVIPVNNPDNYVIAYYDGTSQYDKIYCHSGQVNMKWEESKPYDYRSIGSDGIEYNIWEFDANPGQLIFNGKADNGNTGQAPAEGGFEYTKDYAFTNNGKAMEKPVKFVKKKSSVRRRSSAPSAKAAVRRR